MRAGLRFRTILLAAGAMLAPASALAQDTTPPATTNTPATNAIGPRELQNFSLPGTTTRPAEPPAPAPAPATATPSRRTAVADTPAPRSAAQAPASRRTERAVASAPAPITEAPSAPLGASLPPPTQAVPGPALQPAAIGSVAADAPAPAEPIVAERKLWIMPWLLAVLALVAGIAFLLWHRRAREAYAGGPEIDLFVAPEPVPAPAPRAAAPRPAALPPKPVAPSPKSGGIVAARLRPSLELGMQPLRCVVDDAQVTIEFEIELFNAGAAQEQELAAFFANPIAAGEGLDVIEPLKRLAFTNQVVAPRDAIQEYELAGRKTFVPLIAFNAVYEWSGSKGQTSAAYLVGRGTGGDKLGPMRLDLGAREFRGLAAHALPSGLKT